MQALNSGELRFNYLVFSSLLGEFERVFDELEASIHSDHWFTPWFLQRTTELKPLAENPRYQAALSALAEVEQAYRRSGAFQPVLQMPHGAQPPYPLLIALHGNGYNPQHSAEHWECAAEAGWLVFHPTSEHLVGRNTGWWDNHEENIRIVTHQVEPVFNAYPVDPQRILLGGFSKGGETAMVLALQKAFRAKGFITVGAGGYYHLQPDLWQPLIDSAPKDIRGICLYSPYDHERGDQANPTIEMLQAAGLDVREERYYAEGHRFPDEFSEYFRKASEYIMRNERNGNLYE
jgi:predicted esterase